MPNLKRYYSIYICQSKEMQQGKSKKKGLSHGKTKKRVASPSEKIKKCNKKLGFRVKLVPMLVGSRFFHFFYLC